MARIDGDDVNSSRLLEVLREARSLLARPGNDFSSSSWQDAAAALRELDALIEQIKTGSPPARVDLGVLFAPTGPVQEVSLRSGWAERFITLAEELDAALEAP